MFGGFSGNLIWWHVSPVPDPAHGYIFPINDHGTTEYVSSFQNWLENYSFFIVAAGFGLLILGRTIQGKNFFGEWRD
jgi:hypothetical protein